MRDLHQPRRPGRPNHDPEQTRRAILEAAVEAFAERGYAGANLRSISKDAGVTLGTLTHHFPSKAELFVTCYAHAARLIGAGYAAAVDGAASVHDELAAMLRRSAQFMEERPSLTRLVIRAATDVEHPKLRASELGRPIHDVIDGVASRAVARGEVAVGDGAALIALLQSMLWGLSMVGVDSPQSRAASVRGFELVFRSELLARPTLAGST